MTVHTAIAFTPEKLASRWEVSATTVRDMCKRGELGHFKAGKQYRIPAKIVEELEQCQTSQLDGYAVDTASSGMMRPENESAINLRHAPERKPRAKVVTDT
jgi:excisionase family DNA binding protein